METKNYFSTDAAGNILPSATCYVYEAGTLDLASGVTSINGAPLSNPFTAQPSGLVQFKAPDGEYDLRVVKSGRDFSIRIQCFDGVEFKESLPDLLAASNISYSGSSVESALDTLYLSNKVNVLFYGENVGTGVDDDFQAFQDAINALPAMGGTIIIPGRHYVLSAVPVESGKSILWDIDPAAYFTGAGTGEGKFGYMLSNPAQLAVGPYIRSRSNLRSTNTNGGIAALNAEMIQPSDYVGQSVAAYFGAIGSSANLSANVWALNTLVRSEAGAKGTYQCIEVDVDNFSADALVKGISISGAGTVGPRVALEIVRANNTPWAYGIDILNATTGIRVRASTQTRIGILVGAPAAQLNAVLSGKLLANGDDGVLLERFTDTSPTGNFFRAVNAANNTNLFSVASSGSINTAGSLTAALNVAATAGNITASAGYVRGSNIDATGPVSAAPNGVLRLSASTSLTVGAAGGAAARPATPAMYITVNYGGQNYKLALENA